MRRRVDPLAVAVGLGCLWELLALCSRDRLPTITSMSWRLRRHRFGRLALWLVLGKLLDHILAEGYDGYSLNPVLRLHEIEETLNG